MNPIFNWHVLSENTMRSYEQAAKDFNLVTGLSYDQATVEAVASWHASMIGRKLATSTIRQRLSAMAVMSGIKVQLPKREAAEVQLLNAEEIRRVMAEVKRPSDRMQMIRVLMLGGTVLSQPEQPAFYAHFLNSSPAVLTAKGMTRLLKRYARKAGLDPKQISMRIWHQSGRNLAETMDVRHLVEMFDQQVNGPEYVNVKRLHGINRRSISA